MRFLVLGSALGTALAYGFHHWATVLRRLRAAIDRAGALLPSRRSSGAAQAPGVSREGEPAAAGMTAQLDQAVREAREVQTAEPEPSPPTKQASRRRTRPAGGSA